ncbi:MBL fold metallo-hydrolase [Paenibacillus senegalensis]|uniref:MBL fold metallo-hydrolase n=1 Tax=Paenibacillus senegalensis TaxID=1465766 RepID=UPI000288AA63|nr:MBL fold metallo-hydrolase [Paenibacillus senegalensis]
MLIAPEIHLVGSGQFGFQITDLMDCNVYLIDAGSEAFLIDAGGGVQPELIVKQIEQSGISTDKITRLLLTHIHGDHAAGASYFQQRYGWKVIVSKEAAPWLEAADHDKTSLNAAIAAGVYPENFKYEPCPVSRSVEDGDRLEIGNVRLQVIETPGHSRGHVSYVWERQGQRLIFSGDVIFAGGKIVLQQTWDCVIQDYAKSIERLHELNIDALFPGHGPFITANAARHIAMAHSKFARLELPPNL